MTDIYPPAAFKFVVQFDDVSGAAEASFQEVSGLGTELEVESFREGGENRFLHSLPKGLKHPKLILKRGIADSRSQLVRWCKDVLEGGLSQPVETKSLVVSLLDETGAVLRCWAIQNAYPSAWSVDAFSADKNTITIEKMEVSFSTSSRTS